MQYFKGDDLEKKFEAAFQGIVDDIGIQLDAFHDGAYSASPLGDVLYEDNRSPLANAIDQDIYRETFNEVFTAFRVAGSFESYLDVFKKIFGETVEVTFTVPDPGKLQIDIVATELEIFDLVARRVVNGAYVLDEIIDDEGDNIAVRLVKGFQSQYELEQMLFEMVPDGIYTEISLSFGE